jgi:phosphate transport system substrate-binding protein
VRRFLFLVAAVGLAGCSGSQQTMGGAQSLTGGGSSFVNPVMTRWAAAYHKARAVQVDYTATGSGNGIRQMLDRKNDFGCTDAPLSEEQIREAKANGGDVLHIPLVMGGVVPAYNLPEVKEPLNFTGPVLADIYLGKITRWNDSRLKELNPTAALPDKEIAVVRRSDGSGTTYIWSDYLAKVSPEWKEKVGVGTDLKWPVGVGAQKNDGVAGQVGRSPGAIGYVELTFALKSNIQFGAVKNKAGEFVRADLASVMKAAAGALTGIPDDLRYSLTDAPGGGAYPICGTTWAVCFTDQPGGKAKTLADFLRWAVHEGQGDVEELQYARLPEGLVKKIEPMLDRIKAK